MVDSRRVSVCQGSTDTHEKEGIKMRDANVGADYMVGRLFHRLPFLLLLVMMVSASSNVRPDSQSDTRFFLSGHCAGS